MAKLFPSRSSKNRSDYDLWRLVDTRFFKDLGRSEGRVQIVCDIDKTYLETQFESLVKMARIPFEDAEDKVTVEGAREVLLAMRWGAMPEDLQGEEALLYPRPLHFVSSSPPQLRRVLEEKLAGDGLDWTSDTFKNQAYNIKKGRFDLLKQQVAYKSAAILGVMERTDADRSFIMLGDNAESDAYIYLGLKLYGEGRLSSDAFAIYLGIAEISDDVVGDLLERFPKGVKQNVSLILIRDLTDYSLPMNPPLTDPVFTFGSFFESALILLAQGYLDPRCLLELTRTFHNLYDLSVEDAVSYLKPFADHHDGRVRQSSEEVRTHFARWAGDTDLTSDLVVSRSLAGFEALGEDQILGLAKEWFDKLAARHQ